MKTAVINIKTNPKIKMEAQKVAAELGLSLSAVINGYLREFVEVEKIYFKRKPSKNKKSLPFGMFSGAEISEKEIDEVTLELGKTVNEPT